MLRIFERLTTSEVFGYHIYIPSLDIFFLIYIYINICICKYDQNNFYFWNLLPWIISSSRCSKKVVGNGCRQGCWHTHLFQVRSNPQPPPHKNRSCSPRIGFLRVGGMDIFEVGFIRSIYSKHSKKNNWRYLTHKKSALQQTINTSGVFPFSQDEHCQTKVRNQWVVQSADPANKSFNSATGCLGSKASGWPGIWEGKCLRMLRLGSQEWLLVQLPNDAVKVLFLGTSF